MKTVLKIKLITDSDSHCALLRTMNMFNLICNRLSHESFNSKVFHKIQMQREFYPGHREAMPEFSSQLLIRAIDVVSQSYKVKRGKYPNLFKPTSAVVYDDRVISFLDSTVSIWTVSGRLHLPMQIWNSELFKFRKGQVDLIYENHQLFLLTTIEIPEESAYDASGIIGVDLGVKNIAVDSTGEIFSSNIIEQKRKKYHSYRQRLQKRGTRSAKRRLKSFGKKESRFRKNINHQISKHLVSKAKGTLCAIALEDLSGINQKVTVCKQNRNERMSWSFFQLRQFITYKSAIAGITIILINPAYTSLTCSVCGHCEKHNRKSQSLFRCVSCGHTENADFNASKNISAFALRANRAAVNQPIALAA